MDKTLLLYVLIALATCAVAVIYFNSNRNRRKQRTWELNKDLLLRLTDSLNQVVHNSKAAIKYEQSSIESGGNESHSDIGFSASDRLDNQIEYALEVCAPLMDKKILQRLEDYRVFAKKNKHAIVSGEMNSIKGYKQLIAKTEKTHKKLLEFVASLSGVKNA